MGRRFRTLLERRSLLWQMARRDFEQRFVGSAAGWLWGLIHPLVMVISWTFVFEYCLRTPVPDGEVTKNYTLFLLCGYLPWMLFNETVTRSANSMLEHANLITKTVFPAEIIPVSIFLSSLMNHLLAVGLTVAVIGFWESQFHWMLLLLPVYMLLIGMLGVGLGWIFAALQVYLRDTAQVLLVILTFWFWLTPVFIAPGMVPERFRFLILGNPLSYAVRAYRDRLLSALPVNWGDLAVLTAFSISAFVLGGLFFRHLKRGFADVL